MVRQLICHPATPGPRIQIGVSVTFTDDDLARFRYEIRGAIDRVAWPSARAAQPGFRDGLWKTTCLEAFCKRSDDNAYREFNFSPSGDWAAYGFSRYRAGMVAARTLRGLLVAVIPASDGMIIEGLCDPTDLDGADLFALTAVIEEIDDTKSYWSLAHPPGAPDFHHPDCFALKVPAVGHP